MNKHPDANEGNVTRDELRTVLKAMDKEGFGKIMDEYMHEISDPKNIKESNEYLEQMAQKKDLPSNVKLAKPSMGFCIKSKKYNIKRQAVKTKVYVNICSLDQIKKPESDDRGYWSVPYLINKGRNDQDSKGKLCITYDVVFHPESVSMATKHAQFKKFVCDSAVDGLNNSLLAKNNEKMSKDYSYVSKFTYKGGEVAFMNVHSLSKSEFSDKLEGASNYKSKVQREIEEVKQAEEESENELDQPDVEVNDRILEEDSNLPHYVIKFSRDFEISQHFYSPEELQRQPEAEICVIEIKVPKMKELNKALLNLEEKKLSFKYLSVYELNIEFKSRLDKSKGKAEFDRERHILKISCPVFKKEQPKKPQMETKTEENKAEEPISQEKEDKPIKEDKVQKETNVAENKDKVEEKTNVAEKEDKQSKENKMEELPVPTKKIITNPLEILREKQRRQKEIEQSKLEETKPIENKESSVEPQPVEEEEEDEIVKPKIKELPAPQKEPEKKIKYEFFDFECELITEIDQ